ncbi:hypothetical protein BaRGS_00038391 [Batillaria attramentaria]|uniref:ZU5 domain-containing protein n=1 Tax=Batillaria attramentaria TaxID=370345 RepID=A0ABD0J5V5_9CAEN
MSGQSDGTEVRDIKTMSHGLSEDRAGKILPPSGAVGGRSYSVTQNIYINNQPMTNNIGKIQGETTNLVSTVTSNHGAPPGSGLNPLANALPSNEGAAGGGTCNQYWHNHPVVINNNNFHINKIQGSPNFASTVTTRHKHRGASGCNSELHALGYADETPLQALQGLRDNDTDIPESFHEGYSAEHTETTFWRAREVFGKYVKTEQYQCLGLGGEDNSKRKIELTSGNCGSEYSDSPSSHSVPVKFIGPVTNPGTDEGQQTQPVSLPPPLYVSTSPLPQTQLPSAEDTSEGKSATGAQRVLNQTPLQPIFSSKWQTVDTVTSNGGTVRKQYSDVILTVPSDAVDEDSQVDIHTAVCTNCDRVRRVVKLSEDECVSSPVAEYWAGHEFRFKKPVTITLPHFLPPDPDPSLVRVYCVTRRPDGQPVISAVRPVSNTIPEAATTNVNVVRPLEHHAGSSQSVDDRSQIELENATATSKASLGVGKEDMSDKTIPRYAVWHDTAIFELSKDFVYITTDHFSAYLCIYCGHNQGPPVLTAMVCGNYMRDASAYQTAQVSVHVWDKRMNIADYREDEGIDLLGDILTKKSLNMITHDDLPNSRVCMRLRMIGRNRASWQHCLADDDRPGLPVEQDSDLRAVLSCDNDGCKATSTNNTRPISASWMLETRPDLHNVQWLQCTIELCHVPPKTLPKWTDTDDLERMTRLPVTLPKQKSQTECETQSDHRTGPRSQMTPASSSRMHHPEPCPAEGRAPNEACTERQNGQHSAQEHAGLGDSSPRGNHKPCYRSESTSNTLPQRRSSPDVAAERQLADSRKCCISKGPRTNDQDRSTPERSLQGFSTVKSLPVLPSLLPPDSAFRRATADQQTGSSTPVSRQVPDMQGAARYQNDHENTRDKHHVSDNHSHAEGVAVNGQSYLPSTSEQLHQLTDSFKRQLMSGPSQTAGNPTSGVSNFAQANGSFMRGQSAEAGTAGGIFYSVTNHISITNQPVNNHIGKIQGETTNLASTVTSNHGAPPGSGLNQLANALPNNGGNNSQQPALQAPWGHERNGLEYERNGPEYERNGLEYERNGPERVHEHEAAQLENEMEPDPQNGEHLTDTNNPVCSPEEDQM